MHELNLKLDNESGGGGDDDRGRSEWKFNPFSKMPFSQNTTEIFRLIHLPNGFDESKMFSIYQYLMKSLFVSNHLRKII